MAELRAEGRSLAEIGRLFGVSRERVRQLLRRYDGERAGTARRKELGVTILEP
jgi:hypothetical protein